MKQVNKLLNKEKQAKEAIKEAQNVLANIGAEKEQLGVQIIAEAQEKLDVLGVGYLLSNNTNIVEKVMAPVRISRLDGRVLALKSRKQDIERITLLETQRKDLQNTINDLVKELEETKGAVKEVVKEVKVKVEDTTRIDELTAEIAELNNIIATQEKKEKEYAAVIKELNESLKKMEAELEAVKETTEGAVTVEDEFNEPGYQEILENAAYAYMNNNTDECLFIADDMELENNANKGNGDKDKQIGDTVKNVLDNRKGDGKRKGTPKERLINEFNNITDEDIDAVTFEIPTGNDNKEESKQEESEVKAPEFVKEVCAQVGKNVNAKLYQTESCFLIASSTTKEMTWIADGPISDEYKAAVEQMLVAEKKILPTRVELSPVIVQTEDGYMARAKAANGVDKFADEDVVVGYVKIDGKFYLYSYGIQYRSPGQKNIKSLDAILNNDPIVNPDEKMCARVTNRVWKMKKQYLQEVKEMIEQKDAQAKANSDARKEKKDKRKSRFQANTELVLQSGIEVGKKTSKLTGLNVEGNGGDKTAVGQMVDDFAASLF